jgi:ribonuclease P protein component
MLQKEYRLKKRTAFKATYRTGVSIHKDGITVFCGRKKTNDLTTKIGFVVSKKIHKRAVKRNRIKRLMRECVRLYIKNNTNFDTKYQSLIFVATGKLLNKSFKEVDSGINKIMSIITNA